MSSGLLDNMFEEMFGEGKSNNHPHVIANGNHCMSDVVEVWSGSMTSDGNLDAINKKLTAGFEILRIQTELSDNNHVTRIYLVKRKPATVDPPTQE